MRKSTEPPHEQDQLWPALDQVNEALRMLWARGERVEARVKTTTVGAEDIHQVEILIERG